ncbi:MAG TPA: outer membrane beta-barrel protein [Acidobacteriaceae bacterium]
MNDCSPGEETLLHHRISRRNMRRTRATLLCCFLIPASFVPFCAPSSAHAQVRETASRVGDLQIGGGFVYSTSDYNFTPIHLIGIAGYTTFDKRHHWGGEFDFHHNRSSADSTVYERTYEIGPRVFVARGPFIPYAKVMYGRGVYNFHNSIANVAYNIYTFGGGADFQVRRSLNVRADYEYQSWMNFPLGTLHPNVITIGVAYHFHE